MKEIVIMNDIIKTFKKTYAYVVYFPHATLMHKNESSEKVIFLSKQNKFVKSFKKRGMSKEI